MFSRLSFFFPFRNAIEVKTKYFQSYIIKKKGKEKKVWKERKKERKKKIERKKRMKSIIDEHF